MKAIGGLGGRLDSVKAFFADVIVAIAAVKSWGSFTGAGTSAFSPSAGAATLR